MSLLEKAASVLEAVAADLDRGAFVPTPMSDAEKVASGEDVDALAFAYTQATGETADPETLAELARNDVAKSTIFKVASRTPSVDALGGPLTDSPSASPGETPLKGSAAIEAAREKFANAILNLSNRD